MTRIALAAYLVAASAGCIIDASSDLTVANRSSYVIEALFVTPTHHPDWGPDRLHGHALFPNESVVIDVSCGHYDALIRDERGLQCEVDDLDLCFDDATWVIRDNTCAVFSAP